MATARKRPRVPRLGLLVAGRPSRSSGPRPLRPCSGHRKDTCMLRVLAVSSGPLRAPQSSALLQPQDFPPEGGGAARPSFGSEGFRRQRWRGSPCGLPGEGIRRSKRAEDLIRENPAVESGRRFLSPLTSSSCLGVLLCPDLVWLWLPGPQQCPAGLGCQLLLTNERHRSSDGRRREGPSVGQWPGC